MSIIGMIFSSQWWICSINQRIGRIDRFSFLILKVNKMGKLLLHVFVVGGMYIVMGVLVYLLSGGV